MCWVAWSPGCRCFYIWHESLNLISADYVSLNVESQPWRRSQYLCFHPPDCGVPIHVYHCHCPSPGEKNKLAGKDKRFLISARKSAVGSICAHAARQHAAQQIGVVQPDLLQVGGVQPDFPAVLVTGDWNLPLSQWRTFLHEYLLDHVCRNIQVVKSTMARVCQHGDITIAINCKAFQEEAPELTFSDAHDVVIAAVSLPGIQVSTPVLQPLVSAEQPHAHDVVNAPVTLPAIQVDTPVLQPLVSGEQTDAHDVVNAPVTLPVIQLSTHVLEPVVSAEQPDAHDVVNAPMTLPAIHVSTPVLQPLLTAERPDAHDVANAPATLPAIQVSPPVLQPVVRAEQPDVHDVFIAPLTLPAIQVSTPVLHPVVSAEQPRAHVHFGSVEVLRFGCDGVPADDLSIPLNTTPLCAKMIANIADVDHDAVDTTALDELERTFMFGNVPEKPVPRHSDQEKPNRVERLEWVLELLLEQRSTHTQKLQERNDPRVSAAQPDIQFSDNDMQEIMNGWRNNPSTWMNEDKLETLDTLQGQQHHKFVKSRFGAMKFHLLGNESLVDHIIRFNLCGAVQPAALLKFCECWSRYTQTEQYLKVRKESEKQEPGHVRRAKVVWNLKQQISRGQWITDWIDESRLNWYQLSIADKKLYESMGDLQNQLEEVMRTTAGTRHPGSASSMNRM
jgi:hypothetical protein